VVPRPDGRLMAKIGGWRKAERRLLPEATLACLRTGVVTLGLFITFPVEAQESAPQPANEPVAQPPANQAPTPSFQPGFIDALGRWLGDSKAALDSQLRSTQDAIGGVGSHATDAVKGATDAAQQATGVIVGGLPAADALVALPGTRVITGHARCGAAPNGAPDCGPAANVLCQAKGFKSGRGVEVTAGKSCSTRTWLTRRNPGDGPCATVTYVTRAVCQ
jgi:hypothetical protein